ncbi:hypothetical protein AAFF_G00093040 [Aldrovandia affinis]|uniref:Synenkephalin n=1 Tax=Aldrovandia affinis TaxID=143900 RepID=A0AAD7WY72_9TELE|nr:hypothetical protein AAFF_G00093040 [Aldrovandia affinis]
MDRTRFLFRCLRVSLFTTLARALYLLMCAKHAPPDVNVIHHPLQLPTTVSTGIPDHGVSHCTKNSQEETCGSLPRDPEEPMALSVSPCWMLVLSACLVPMATAECDKDCAYCIYHMQGRQTEINTLTCTLECEGKLTPKRSWDLCKDVLQGDKPDSLTEEDQGTTESVNLENDEHQLAKKYGGFMKRYGGFMKKTAELYDVEPDDEDHGREILAKRYGGFMKKDGEHRVDALNILNDIVNAEGGTGAQADRDGEILKRYGGFMRSVKRSSELEEGIKELQKRYGGFMRRVGRPEWKEDKKRYGGFLRRSWEEDGENNSESVPDMEKRYGGFMDY